MLICFACWLSLESDLIEQTTARIGIDETQARMGIGLILKWTRQRVTTHEYTTVLRAIPLASTYVASTPDLTDPTLRARFRVMGLDERWLHQTYQAI